MNGLALLVITLAATFALGFKPLQRYLGRPFVGRWRSQHYCEGCGYVAGFHESVASYHCPNCGRHIDAWTSRAIRTVRREQFGEKEVEVRNHE